MINCLHRKYRDGCTPSGPYLQADMDQGKEVQESYQSVLNRALEVHSFANPVRKNPSLACVFLPEDVIEGMKTEVGPSVILQHCLKQT
jgi:hypothetical protein